jgi:predicted nuclease with TOPRIM domain
MCNWTEKKNSSELDQVQKDMKKLRELCAELERLDNSNDENMQKHETTFKDMLHRMETGRLLKLTLLQRNYLNDLHERLVAEPGYENLVSSGLVPRGKEVEKPDVLKKLPLRPPGRKQEWKE